MTKSVVRQYSRAVPSFSLSQNFARPSVRHTLVFVQWPDNSHTTFARL